MFARRSATALARISAAGLAATVLAIPAHANTDVTVTAGGPNEGYASTINVSAITASDDSDGTPTSITVRVDEPGGFNGKDVWIKPIATDATVGPQFSTTCLGT